MIRHNSFMTAVATASAFAARGQSLVALPGTPMSELVSKSALDPEQLTSLANFAMDTTQNLAESYSTYLWMETDDQAGAPSPHSLLLGTYVDQIKPFVAAHISYAKNVVKPLVVAFAESLSAKAQSLKGLDPASTVNLCVRKLPSLMQDESFLDTLSYYKDRTPIAPEKAMTLAPKLNDEIRALMITGHQRTDEMIVSWLSEREADFPVKIWGSFFAAEQQVKYYAPSDIDAMDPFEKLNVMLGAHLVARKIFDNVQEGDIPLAAYKDQVITVRDYTATSLVLILKTVLDLIETRILVLGSDYAGKTLYVNGELYPDWLSKGGKPEILMGMLTSNNIAKSIALIDEKAAEHERAWNAYVMFATTQLRNTFYDNYRLSITQEFMVSLTTQDEAEQEVTNSTTDRLVRLAQDAETWLASLSNQELDDSYCLALHLVARIRFCHTSAYQILSDIDAACKANPNVDVREAALMAAINYIGDWLADQITLAK